MNPKLQAKITEKLNRIKVKDVMTRSPITTTPDENLSDLADIFIKSKISGVPVVNASKKMVGIITTTDFLRLMGEMNKGSFVGLNQEKNANVIVGDVMTKSVMSVNETHTLHDVVNIMCDKKIHTIPVTKDDQLIGVVGRRDVIMYFYAALRDSVEESNQ